MGSRFSSSPKEYDAFRIPLEDIVNATKNFAEENLLKRGGNADVYKGLLLQSDVRINVVIWKHSSTLTFNFYEEIMRISGFKHRNLVSFIGFCDEKDERIIVMEHAVNGSLDKYLSDPIILTWSQRLHICFGAALALTRIHNAGKSFKILLDKDWEAKVLIGTNSELENENSDKYSLGVILLEVLYGRKATTEDVNHYLKIMAKPHNYEEGKHLDGIIAPNLRAQMHPQSLSTFSETTYNCLNEQPDNQRAYMSVIMGRLKEAFDIQWEKENLLRVKKLAYLKIPMTRIKLATNNFSNPIKFHGYDRVYKGELIHFDREIQGENKRDLKKVIINRISKYQNTTKDFFTEIEMLTSSKHPNLLPLLGFCYEDSEMILVFECAFKETLYDYLGSTENMTDLTWEKRIRICLDIAHGLKYLQNMEGKPSTLQQVIHVFLDKKLNATIYNSRLSKFNLYTSSNTEPKSLWQSRPENFRTWLCDAMIYSPSARRLVVDDIYTLGVILFQILTGKPNFDPFYMKKTVNGLSPDKGKLMKLIDPRIMEETLAYTSEKGPNKVSFDTIAEVAYQCLADSPRGRPRFEVVIKSLEKALHFQVVASLRIPHKVLHLATNNFNEAYLIGSGAYGAVYKAELDYLNNRSPTVAIKRIINREDGQGKAGFFAEIGVLSRCDHPNIVSLLGCCEEGFERLLVYEYASNGSLDSYLENNSNMSNLTWALRLKMCIDIAKGLGYLHTIMEDKERIIHRDIKSANILLGENLEARIADFGLSKVHHNRGASTINTENVAGTNCYVDPEYAKTGRLKNASDIYSFGVVLFEIYSGTLAHDSKYTREKEKGLAPIARRHFQNGTLKELLDPKIMDEPNDELGFIVKVGPDHDSLDAFSKIANKCIAKTQVERPTIEVIIKELEKALSFQENRMKTLKISLEHIKTGVQNFSDDRCIIRGGNAMLYKGKIQYHTDSHKNVVVKRFSLDRYSDGVKISWEHAFVNEFEVLFKYKQENIIGLVGCCIEMEEKIIVYDQASKGSLSRYLKDTSLSWSKRLKISIDIAMGLKFLHGGDVRPNAVIHRDLKSSNILLTQDWKAKICGFEHALMNSADKEIEFVISDVAGSSGYCDPLYRKTKILTKESDIYSFGVILFEILCGRLACTEESRDGSQFLDVLAKLHFQVARLDEIVFEGIKEQIDLQSFATFRSIAFQCLHEEKEERPTAGDVVVELQKALEFQESYERREAELHRNYKEVRNSSKSPEIYSKMVKTYINDLLSEGILNEDDKLEIIQDIQRTIRDLEKSVQVIREEDDDHLVRDVNDY